MIIKIVLFFAWKYKMFYTYFYVFATVSEAAFFFGA